MGYQSGGETQICDWKITWESYFETWSNEDKKMGAGRFLAISENNEIACRITILNPGLKVETSKEYSVQILPDEKKMHIIG